MAKPSSRNTKTNEARASRPDANTLLRADHGLRTVLELHQVLPIIGGYTRVEGGQMRWQPRFRPH